MLSLVGCMKSLTPATVSQVEDVRAIVKGNAEIIAKLANETAPNTPIAFEAKSNANNIQIAAPESGFQYINETVMALVMAASGLGGVNHVRKKNTIIKKVVEMNPEDGHKHLTEVS